jgi:hypothetical protein
MMLWFIAQVDGKPPFSLWCFELDTIGSGKQAICGRAGGQKSQNAVNLN